MPTNLDIIKGALRKLRVLGGGREPTTDQASDAMSSLQCLIEETVGTGGLGRLNDVITSMDYTAREFDRIRCDAAVTITLPLTITPQMFSYYDYSWVYDYGWRCELPRPPYDRAPVIVVTSAGVETTSLYSAYQGKWVTINGLGQQDNFPFAEYFKDGFSAMLAEAISEEYGREPGPITTRQANRCRFMLSYHMDSAARRKPQRSAFF